MDIERLLSLIVVSVVMGIAKRIFKFTISILVIGIVLALLLIYKDIILEFIKGVILESDKLTLLYLGV